MQRRSFIKGACRICLLGTSAAAVAAMASCSPASGKNILHPEVKNNKVLIPLSTFDAAAFQIISPAKFQFEIAVERKADNTYSALLLSCTHYSNELTVTGNGFICSAHGSRFDKQGNVLKGPAENALKQLRTQIINNDLLIHL